MIKSIFFKNTSILTLSNIISGILIFTFTLVLSREIGAKGMGLYQLVMPLYTILIYTTGGGISIAMSRIGAATKVTGGLMEFYRTIKLISKVVILWSILVTGFIMFTAHFFSNVILSDSRTYLSILALCPGLLFSALASIYRGSFYGVQRVSAPAIIDIIEKLFKIIILYYIISKAKNLPLEYTVSVAIVSLSLGEFIGFILFYLSFKYYKWLHPVYGKCDNDFQLIFNVLTISLPISLEGIISGIFSTITAILIPKRLGIAGYNYDEALSLLGKLQGMAINIALFPMLVINAFNMLLVPTITEAASKHNHSLLNHRINSAISVASTTAFFTAGILVASPITIGNYFYKDILVGRILLAIIPALPLVYLESVSFSILNGLGGQGRLLRNSIIVQTIDIILLYIFLGTRKLNIYGYGINMAISSMIGIYLNYRFIKKTTDLQIDWKSRIIIPLLCGFIIYLVASNFIFIAFDVPISLGISLILYFSLLFSAYAYLRTK